jgi:DnaJ like chaperone protein
MDPLALLGLRSKAESHVHLHAIRERVRELLPADEAVVVRYIVVVAVLLTRVAHSDGRVLECELDHLRVLFRHIDRMPPDGIDVLCATLNEHVPQLSEEELQVCFHEIKSLCNAEERRQIMRLLASQATSDGHIVGPEHGTLLRIADALDVPLGEMEQIEIDALSADRPPVSFDSMIPDGAEDPAS